MNTLETYKPQVKIVDVKEICDTEHYWQPGVYIRKMFGKASHIYVGAEHKETHTNIVVSGSFDLMVNGGEPQLITAPMVFTSNAGDQKTAYFHSDTVWLNIMSNEDDETDIEVLDSRYVIDDTPQIQSIVQTLHKLEQQQLEREDNIWLGQ